MRRNPLVYLFLNLVLVIGAGSVWAADYSSQAIPPSTADLQKKEALGLVDYDAHFLTKIHMANQDEIKLGKLAQENGNSDSVKEFGKHLVSDHQAIDDQLYKVANLNRVTLGNPPLSISEEEKTEMQRSKDTFTQLSSLKGSDFDTAFRQAMMDDHKQDVADVQKAIPNIRSSSVKQFAKNLLPKLRMHQSMASNIKPDSSSYPHQG